MTKYKCVKEMPNTSFVVGCEYSINDNGSLHYFDLLQQRKEVHPHVIALLVLCGFFDEVKEPTVNATTVWGKSPIDRIVTVPSLPHKPVATQIEQKQWEEKYFIFSANLPEQVDYYYWRNDITDRLLLSIGNVHKTKEEALAYRDRLIAAHKAGII